MKTIICCSCKIEKVEEEFSWSKKAENKRNGQCKACYKEYKRQYYLKNKKLCRQKADDRKEKIKEWYIDYKSKQKCEICFESCPACLDFHHINDEEKEICVAQAVARNWSISNIKKEIDKCVVVCANCHRKIHAGIIKLS